MNPTLEVLGAHRTIRRYTDDPVEEEHVRAAVQAGQRASTSSAVQAYALLRVRDRATRERLAALTGDQEKVARAGAFFVVLGDTRRHRLACAREGVDYDARLEAFLVAVIDASLFAQNVCVAFESLGYGICYVGGLRNDLAAVDRLLALPRGVYPLYGLCVGRPAEDPLPRPRLPLDAVLLEERYPDDDNVLGHLDAHEAAVGAYYAERGLEGRTWAAGVAAALSAPRRPALAATYAEKGADLS
jgi:nitroreductase